MQIAESQSHETVWWLWIATFGTPASQLVPNCASITPAFCQSFCMVRRLGPWQQRLQTFDALDQWCLCRILNIHWTDNEVQSITQQPFLSDAVRSRCLCFFGHICRADPRQDHSWALYASNTGLLKHWRRPGRPRQTWLRTIENDLQPLNLGLATAQRCAMNRTAWHTLMETATSLTSSGWCWWWWYLSVKCLKRCHAQELREANCHAFITQDLWPPNSHNLNPVNYKIWVIVQQSVNRKKVQDVNDLRLYLPELEWNRALLMMPLTSGIKDLDACILATGQFDYSLWNIN